MSTTASVHVPRSNQHDRSVLNNAQLNILVDKVFARVLDLAQSRPVHYNAVSSRYELETLDVERMTNASHVLNTPRLDYFLPADDSPGTDIKFMVLNHTCPICLTSYENPKVLIRHFINEHIVAKSAHKCSICDRFMSIDEFFKHAFSDEAHLTLFLIKEFRTFYSLFMMKFIQDILVNYYTNGSCCILKLRNAASQQPTTASKLAASSQAASLIERMSVKMNEIFFGRAVAISQSTNPVAANNNNTSTAMVSTTNNVAATTQSCKPFNCLSSKSIRSNLACNNKRVTQADLVAEMLKYAQLESQSTAAATFLKTQTCTSKTSYLQCTLCFTLLDDHPDELKMHIVQSHVYNETLNKCIVCCYCRQILKSNSVQVNVVDLFNEHVMSNECSGVKQGLMPSIGIDWFLYNPTASRKRKLDDANGVGDPTAAGDHCDIAAVEHADTAAMADNDDEAGLVENEYAHSDEPHNNNEEYFDEEEAAVARDLNDDDDDDGNEVDFEGDDECAVAADTNAPISKRLKNEEQIN